MQSNGIICKTPKTFGEVWDSLSETEQDKLFLEFFKSEITNNKITIWYWRNGLRRPANKLVRKAIVKAVNKITKGGHTFESLFPLNNE